MSLAEIQERIREACARGTPLQLRGGGTKDFYGNPPRGEVLDTRLHAGIVSYEPSELVVTARCGTPLDELEAALAKERQCLAFEPPHFGRDATFGGCIASGLSGPRRAAAGALRDHVLGVKLVDGRGRSLSFGGQVMKNVAGYDVSRLVVGSLGTLGLIAEASVKVLPQPAAELTLELELSEREAIQAMNRWAGEPLPVSATAWHAGRARVRLSGSAPGVKSAAARLGGTPIDGSQAAHDWRALREHESEFFAGQDALWRLSVPSDARPLDLPGGLLIEWNGALRWVRTALHADAVREAAQRAGGHATLFRAADKSAGAFAPLDPLLARLHRSLKAAFDPSAVLNPGRLYPEL